MSAESSPANAPAGVAARSARVVEVNEALVLGSLHQHELTETAERLNAQLQLEIVARQKAARELAEKARLLDLSNDAIIVRDLENKITLWNKGAERLYGWTAEEVLGRDPHSFLQTEFPKPRKEIEAQFYREGHFAGEVVQIARDGRRIVSLCRWVLDRDTRSILTSYTDITERTQAAEALRASEEFKRSIIESSTDCIKVLDLQGNLLSMEAGRELLGITDLTPLLGKPWVTFWKSDEDQRAAREAVATAAAGGEGHFVGFFRHRLAKTNGGTWRSRRFATPAAPRSGCSPYRATLPNVVSWKSRFSRVPRISRAPTGTRMSSSRCSRTSCATRSLL